MVENLGGNGWVLVGLTCRVWVVVSPSGGFSFSLGFLTCFMISLHVLRHANCEEFSGLPPPILTELIVVFERMPATQGPYNGMLGFASDIIVSNLH